MSPTPEVPANSPFTLHNIPFGVISTSSNPTPRCASAIGDHAIDLGILFQTAEPDIMLGKPAPYQDFEEVFRKVSASAAFLRRRLLMPQDSKSSMPLQGFPLASDPMFAGLFWTLYSTIPYHSRHSYR